VKTNKIKTFRQELIIVHFKNIIIEVIQIFFCTRGSMKFLSLSVFLFCGGLIPLMSYIFSKQGSIDVEIMCNKYVRQKAVKETTARQLPKSEKRKNLASTFV
jgi:hypothetical protein